MVRPLVLAPLAALALSACVVAPVDSGYGMVGAPALPSIVVLGAEPYYYQGGYNYYYANGNWRFATSRSGPWVDLPRSHYPREIRYNERRDERLGLSGRGGGRGARCCPGCLDRASAQAQSPAHADAGNAGLGALVKEFPRL